MKLNTLFVSFLLCLSTPCFAANLEDIYTDENGVTYANIYTDEKGITYAVSLKSIKKIDDSALYQIREAAEYTYRKNGEDLNQYWKATSELFLYDCGSNQKKFLAGTAKKKNGWWGESFWIHSLNVNSWKEVKQEKDKKVLQAVCQYSKTNPQKP